MLDKYSPGVYNNNRILQIIKWGERAVSECKKTKIRSDDEYKNLINRLSRIEGQVRGVRGMVENNAYCIDIMTQVSAISSALSAFNRELLSSHIKSCVVSDVATGGSEKVDELVLLLSRLIK
ncbi:MAG: metal-sensing transcriptional repressor [Oscillospiraceae bacterium]|nr:metal-sensing transcriptional repressor [Oscillospiraceae bacterium]